MHVQKFPSTNSRMFCLFTNTWGVQQSFLFWAYNPISFKHMSCWCPFLDLHLIMYHLIEATNLGLLYLMRCTQRCVCTCISPPMYIFLQHFANYQPQVSKLELLVNFLLFHHFSLTFFNGWNRPWVQCRMNVIFYPKNFMEYIYISYGHLATTKLNGQTHTNPHPMHLIHRDRMPPCKNIHGFTICTL